ncbi:MAG: rod shape-determining protein MreD [Gallionellaceae bacterium CG1_02_56_997]|nr:rod shape-determining protein MreD [Gallionella sp.]OIO77289.1 MAG: rod shape-determining protein MreD [Gallionellaceae bacterium CG1_02_56_997]PIV14612.1 MAG: rod shape-determining protein MreD [Gallionellales bacterium CG03_land_8_20_14_0_80_55_15]PIV91596.1 MAG: rod shape-determining protein MreD [Gallionellales bacterium CG17_big_fil_post_rev_8_21_14_2_50_54_146]PIX05225.1 MAG: rod shape-determining protein MreD [Gallionellales bacterium CG_4_8_14_3_um_filter_54_18]PJC05527.1 MAG: rod s
MQSLDQAQSEILRPVSSLFIITSVLCALLLNALPWKGLWLTLHPDFVAVVLLYWCMHKPLSVGVGMAWMVGVVTDVIDASLFGQHALAYTVLAFGGVVLSYRLRMFDLKKQTSQVFVILSLTYGMYALVHWQVNGQIVWNYFLGCLTSTLLWIPFSILFQSMRQMRVERE